MFLLTKAFGCLFFFPPSSLVSPLICHEHLDSTLFDSFSPSLLLSLPGGADEHAHLEGVQALLQFRRNRNLHRSPRGV